MASSTTTITKKPLKILEVPLSKFKEEVIPHHQKIFTEYKALVQTVPILKLLRCIILICMNFQLIASDNIDQLRIEIRNKKRTVRQLNDLSFELDTLRAQVEDKDLDVFDSKTVSLRKLILSLTNGYSGKLTILL